MDDLASLPSPFACVEMAPRDPILGLTEAFLGDARPHKVNLGVGVYQDEHGRVPLLRAVREAEKAVLEAASPRGYQPIDGPAAYNQAVQKLLFGKEAPILGEGCLVSLQCLGGTGALKVGADFLRRMLPSAKVFISDPSWENHRALFESAGFEVESYPYYDAVTRGVDFEGMRAKLSTLPAGSIVVLHACCHNPTGVDLTEAHWHALVEVLAARALVPFVDMAYQGFGENLEADAFAVRLLAASGLQFLVASSFSKSFALYGERVGALTFVTAGQQEAARVLSQVKRVVRTNYSSPPTHGGALVAGVLSNTALRLMWEEDLAGMRDRIRGIRLDLVEKLKAHGLDGDLSFFLDQRGMFSYTGLTATQVERLKTEFGIYAVSTGRICVAALNSRNVDHVADAIAAVLRS
jgi:aromatic-amino-acid transaminase